MPQVGDTAKHHARRFMTARGPKTWPRTAIDRALALSRCGVLACRLGAVGARRVADDGGVGRNALGYDGTHADYGALADDQGFVRRALLDDGAGADVGVVADVNVAVAVDVWCKRHVVADHAVMGDVRIDVAVKEIADLGVGRDRAVRAKDGAVSDVIAVEHGRAR